MIKKTRNSKTAKIVMADANAKFAELNKICPSADDNWYKPIEKQLKIDGFATSNVNYKTRKVLIATKGFITSESNQFQTYAKSLMSLTGLSSKRVNNLLIKIDNDHNAKIYIDNFPIVKGLILNTEKKMNTFVFEHEVADILEVYFRDSRIDLTPKDGEKFICLIREDFSFWLFWDLSGEMKQEETMKILGSICSRLSFTNAYKFFEPKKFIKFVEYGWYPFAILQESELRYLIDKNGRPSKIWLKQLLPKARLDKMAESWFNKAVFKEKEMVIRAGIDSFLHNNYVASIKTLASEIEGLIAKAYELEKNKDLGYKDIAVCQYLSEKTKSIKRNKLNPIAFIEYMTKSIYKHGMTTNMKKKITRHTASHGRANNEAYTLERNIQIILTINQLFYYL